MRRGARRWGRGLAVAASLLLPAAARPQTLPAPGPVPKAAAPRPDSLPPPAPTFVADTTRPAVVVVDAAEPTLAVTRRTGLRIGAVIAVLTLTTLLLYNVRSR